jgi:flagellar hook-associated protein 3 FlgL
MSSISSNFGRSTNLLMAQTAVSTLGRTNLALHRTHMQLATGIAISRFSDDAVKAAAISVLDERIERATQRQRNMSHADSSLNTLDQALAEAGDLINEARSIASSQLGAGTTAAERQAQAQVVDSLIQSLLSVANRRGAVGHIFGGSTPGSPAVTPFRGGYRYNAGGQGLITDLGIGASIPITLGAGNIVGSTSGRIEGTVDLRPGITADTRLVDLDGARGMGVSLGQIEMIFGGNARMQVDLSGADSLGDVATALNAAIRDYEAAHDVSILGPGGVSLRGRSVSIDVLPGAGGADPELSFTDIAGGQTAADLGLGAFSAAAPDGESVQPRLTWRTPVGSLEGVGGALGSIRVTNLGQSRVVDLSGAQTLEDIRNLMQGTGLGIRVEINAGATGLSVFNEVAGGRGQSMAIEEVPGHNLTATRLGIRSLGAQTRLSDFNDGRGVQISSGATDPVHGGGDPARDTDFTVRLGDSAATTFSVNLRPQDMATVQTLLERINSEAVAAGIDVPGQFEAMLSDGPNGIVLRQSGAFTGAIAVEGKNNSPAAEQLGLLAGSYDAATGSLRAADRAQVRVENLFSHLMDLRQSLLNNDTVGITLAGERMEEAVDRLSQARALVGGYSRRVQDASRRQEDQTLLDEQSRSLMRDVDFSEAAVRLNLLQTQLQGAMTVTAQSLSRSLLDFLG